MKYVLIIFTLVYNGYHSSQHTYNTKEACEIARIEVSKIFSKIYQATVCVPEGEAHDK